MRNLIPMKKWSACRIAPEDTDYSGGGGSDTTGDGDAAIGVYRAGGTEPNWSLTIGNGQMVFDSADGPCVAAATPEPQNTRVGPIYETPEMTVRINGFAGPCQGADGQEYRDTVSVTVGTLTVQGCGGEPVETE
jgi:uncharacterized membrane protein